MSTVHVAIDTHVATITIDRPEARNALSPEVLADLIDAAAALETNDAVRVVVLTGSGAIFIAGADIARMAAMDGAAALEFSRLGGRFAAAIEGSRNPWIAKVNGAALGGGCEVALACDVVIAADSAIFGQPEVTLGTMPGWGATQRLPRRVGIGKALELCLGGAVIDATEAGRIGLADTVVPADQLDTVVTALAVKIAANAPEAVADTKRVLRAGYDLPLAEGLAREAERFAATFTRGDTAEGMGAFLEKPRRTPTFHRSQEA
ncbi:MAG TPA: enoyl-CoA hydratase-related protein [Miltoncostaeales bacterium]|jgi:enoyl-CoA hydratase|nr:enoyl-CoA hydratase-related protein [Miltoncostaeales bacterium]